LPYFEYEKEFNLSPQEASELILNWLFDIKAKVKLEHLNFPNRFLAVHGKGSHIIAPDPQKYKTLSFWIKILDDECSRVRIRLKASFLGFKRESVQKSWENNLFLQLWDRLNTYAQKEPSSEGSISYLIKFVNRMAQKYDFKVPIARIEENFHCKPKVIRQMIERFTYPTVKYTLFGDFIKVNPLPRVEVKRIEIDGNEELEIVDKIEIPLKFYIQNLSRFPSTISIHLDLINLPSGKEHPPFKIDPGAEEEKVIHISTKVKDAEYSIIVMLCDQDKREIPNSNIELKINKKTSKKQKLKNIIKAAVFKSANVLSLEIK